MRSLPSACQSSVNTSLNPSVFFSHNFASLSNSVTNLANLGQANKSFINFNSSSNHSNNHNSISENNYPYANGLNSTFNTNSFNSSNSSSNSNTSVISSSKFVFLFTSDFERIAWLEEINGAIYACKSYFLCIKQNINL